MKIIFRHQSFIKKKPEKTEYLVGTNLLANLEKIDPLVTYRFDQFLLLADETVFRLYGKKVLSSLRKIGKEIAISLIPPGEKTKDFRLLPKMIEPFFQKKISRNSCLISLGGGVVSDIGGFLSSILLRGIASVNLPTTLLGQIDAAIGGKGGVNFWTEKNLMYKNMLGAIRQPILVISDLSTLRTLPKKEILNGLGEMVKYWVGWGKPKPEEILALFSQLKKIPEKSAKTIAACQEIKIKTIKKDPFDTGGERQKLNLGHTIGHAIEATVEGLLSHGESVAIGLAAAAKISLWKKLCQKATYKKIISFLQSLELPTHLPVFLFRNIGTKKEIIQSLKSALAVDKKGGTFVLIKEIGKLETGVFVEEKIINEVIDSLLS